MIALDAIDYRKLKWDDENKHYRYPRSGRKVSDRGMLAIIKSQTDNMKSNQSWSLNQLQNNKMSFEGFQRFNAEMIRDYHTLMMRLGRGGKARTQSDNYLEVLQELRQNQYPRFESFMQQIRSRPASSRYILNRLAMYADSTKTSYEKGRLSYHRQQYGRRRLGSCKDHCQDCLAYASLGWMPVAYIVPPGVACACGGRCCCSVELSDRLPTINRS